MKIELGRLLKMYIFGECLYAGRQTCYSYIMSTVQAQMMTKLILWKFQAPFNPFYTEAEIDSDNLILRVYSSANSFTRLIQKERYS